MSTIATHAVEQHLPVNDAAFHAILEVLHARTGTDFSRYRLSTVARRVANRMISVRAETFEHYLTLLRANDGEAFQLLERVTIKVSRFYRNRATFDALRANVLPTLRQLRHPESLRIWSAGGGCGEEAYTLAMLLDEAGIPGSIEATDIDARALSTARTAHYPAAAIAELPADLRDRYLETSGDHYVVSCAARSRVRFSHHDLTLSGDVPGGSAPFDLVCCRNVLIYFDRETQERALRRLRAAVRDGGFLCLGEAEWPPVSIAASLIAFPHTTRLFRAAI